jgi:hypothetical protein
VLVFPEQMMIERWDLTSLKREESKASPIRAQIVAVAMGSDTSGPILAEWLTDRTRNLKMQDRYSFIDPRTLNVLKVPMLVAPKNQPQDKLSTGGGVIIYGGPDICQMPSISASSDGTVFIARDRVDVSYAKTFELAYGAVRTRFLPSHQAARAVSPDGTLFYLQHRVHDPEGAEFFRLASMPLESVMYLPSSDPGYLLAIAGLEWRTPYPIAAQPTHSPFRLTVLAVGSKVPLATVDGLDEMDELNPLWGNHDRDHWERQEPSFDQRFYWVPPAELLVTIPKSNDRLFLRRLGMPAGLAKFEGDFLYVTSPSVL